MSAFQVLRARCSRIFQASMLKANQEYFLLQGFRRRYSIESMMFNTMHEGKVVLSFDENVLVFLYILASKKSTFIYQLHSGEIEVASNYKRSVFFFFSTSLLAFLMSTYCVPHTCKGSRYFIEAFY